MAKAQMELLWACLTYNLQHWIRLRKLLYRRRNLGKESGKNKSLEVRQSGRKKLTPQLPK